MKTNLKVGDKVTHQVDVQGKHHKAFLEVAKLCNAGATGEVVEVFTTKRAYKRWEFDEPCALVKFPGTAWADGVCAVSSSFTLVATHVYHWNGGSTFGVARQVGKDTRRWRFYPTDGSAPYLVSRYFVKEHTCRPAVTGNSGPCYDCGALMTEVTRG